MNRARSTGVAAITGRARDARPAAHTRRAGASRRMPTTRNVEELLRERTSQALASLGLVTDLMFVGDYRALPQAQPFATWGLPVLPLEGK